MFTAEKNALEAIRRHAPVILLVALVLIGLAMRASLRYVESGDAAEFLLPWYDAIRDGGLGQQVGDYGIPYQSLILLMTFLPIPPLYAYKALSILFDVMLAVEVGLFAHALTESRNKALVAAGVAFVLPAVVLNSAAWAQCDSMYSAFCLAAARRLYQKQYPASFALLGIAFALKLQTVFIVPFFVFAYVLNREFSIVNAVFSAVGFMVPSIPGFVAGRSLADPFAIYLGQTATYEQMYLNYPSFWALAGGDYGAMKNFAILACIAVLGVVLATLLAKGRRIDTPGRFLSLAVWTAWTCVEFLPAMHERYGYLVNILLLVYVLCDRRAALAWLPAVVIELGAYSRYLFGFDANMTVCAAFALAAYALATYLMFAQFDLPSREPRATPES